MSADPREVLQRLDVAVAVVDPADQTITFENARFFQWFPPTGADVEKLPERIPGLKVDRAAGRLGDDRPFQQELTIEAGGREVPLRLRLSLLPGDQPSWLLECADVSKEKEVQYMLDSYSRIAEKNARELQKEKERVEKLLLNIMPKAVVDELQQFGTATPAHFDEVSVVMLDFVGFTDMAISQDPSAIISELNDIFSAFDRIVEMFGCERIRTIGDAYMAVSGVPEASPEHAQNIARVALRMRRYLERRNTAHPQQWLARIGINSGPVIGSLVGISKYVYDLFGPGVNLAARMETASEPMRITCNEHTQGLLSDEFTFTERGEFDIKGFGTQKLFFLESEVSVRF